MAWSLYLSAGHCGLVSLPLCGALWPGLFTSLWGIVAWSLYLSDGMLWPGLFTCPVGHCGLVSLPDQWDIVALSLYLSSGTLWPCLFT